MVELRTRVEKLYTKGYEKLRLCIIEVGDILCFFFSNCFPIAYSEMPGKLAELVSGGLGFHHEMTAGRADSSK